MNVYNSLLALTLKANYRRRPILSRIGSSVKGNLVSAFELNADRGFPGCLGCLLRLSLNLFRDFFGFHHELEYSTLYPICQIFAVPVTYYYYITIS